MTESPKNKPTSKQTKNRFLREEFHLFIYSFTDLFFFQIPFHFNYQNLYGKRLDVTLPFGAIIFSLLNLGTISNHFDRLMSTFEF